MICVNAVIRISIRTRPSGENIMAAAQTLRVNGSELTLASSPDTPLLYVLSDELQLQGPRFGCGLAQCGSCSVLVDGVEIRSCITPLSAVMGKNVTTLEGLPAFYAAAKGLSRIPELTPTPASHDRNRQSSAAIATTAC